MLNEILFVTFMFLTRIILPLALTFALGALLKRVVEPRMYAAS